MALNPTCTLQPTAPMKVRQPGHLWQLDVLRAVAILAVFGFHLIEVVHGHNRFLTTWNHWLVLHQNIESSGRWNWIFFALPLGDVGVTLFFVISGFCIHLSVLQARKREPGGRFNLLNFMWRRLWRIYPGYLVVLAALLALARLLPERPGINGRGDLVAHLLLLHNLFDRYFYSINGSFWSLGVEWQFYLMYPVLFLFLSDRFGVKAAMLAAIIISGTTQVALSLFASQSPAWIASPLMTWVNWCWGALIADYWVNRRRCFTFAPWKCGVIWLTAMVAIVFVPTRYFHDKIWAFAFAVALEQYIHCFRAPKIWERWLIPIGISSYSLYLLHQPLIEPLLRLCHRAGLPTRPAMDLTLTGLMVLALSVAISYVSFSLIEMPGVMLGSAIWKQLAQRARR